jgi:hypothetical protein
MIHLIIRFFGKNAKINIKDADNAKQNDEGGGKQSHDEFQRVGHFK